MESINSFSNFNFSNPTSKALNEMGFVKPTKVQLKTIPLCLKDKDVVVQAKTGSGKTLAFLIPLIEQLYHAKCNSSLGIQAIILVPTAELASQTINILSNLLKYNPNITFLSVIGGKAYSSKKSEWEKIEGSNILVSTVGRLLEHQEKNYNLDLTNLKYLIIDETDYLLDNNFFNEIEAIINFLPKSRITWLFSATQISTLSEIKRLYLKDPIFIGTDSDEILIPKNLSQTFMKIELPDKLQALWNLLEAQNNSNVIVFFSTQKQVLFMHRLFTSLNPNYKLFQIRSNMRLDKRIDSFNMFSNYNNGCVLFATDVASRGLDFPKVSLVIQYDLPKAFDDYIHRVGRTARFNSKGVSLLMIMPSEMAFMNMLKEKNIILKQIRGNVLNYQKKSISEKACLKYSSDLELFKIAKNAYFAYLRDYGKIPEKLGSFKNVDNIFFLNMLPVKKFAKSMGFRSIPEEASGMGLEQTANSFNMESTASFFVKKKSLNTNKKRRLDVSDEEDDLVSNTANVEMKNRLIPDLKPAFNFEEELLALENTSSQDKKYFNSVIKPKYSRKKGFNSGIEILELENIPSEDKTNSVTKSHRKKAKISEI